MLSGRERGGREKRGARVHEEGEKNEERVSCARVWRVRERAHDFSFPRRAVKIARVQPPSLVPRVVPGKLSRPYYRHNNKVNALQIKRTRKTFCVVLCPF